MDVDAVARAAGQLEDLAREYAVAARRIEEVLAEAGKTSSAPRIARETGNLFVEVAGDLRRRVELMRAADGRCWPPVMISAIVDRLPGWTCMSATVAQRQLDGHLRAGSAPAAIFAWWNSLSGVEQAALRRSDARLIASLDGIPPDVRDELNRLAVAAQLVRLRAELAELAGRGVRGPAARGRLAELRGLIASHEAMLAGDLTVLVYDPAGDGRAVVALGDVATASRVGVMVPGITNQLDNYHRMIPNARRLHARASRLGSTDHAVVAWLGYDTPEMGLSAAGVRRAERGAVALVGFVDGVRAVNSRRAEVAVLGHSYGTLVTATASRKGLGADRVVLAGSPGVGAGHVSELGMAAGDVYAVRTADDPIRHVFHADEVLGVGSVARSPGQQDAHGPDPSGPGFGAVPLPYDDRSHGHSQYYEPRSLSLGNHARVMLGREPRAQPEVAG
ncbi:MAG: alpha/beta hydrolase [Pseudonocardiaceae bacterium]